MNLRVHERPRTTVRHRETLWVAPLMRPEIAPVSQACCCPAPAVYAVVVAPTEALPSPPEILLCAHHMYAARERLARGDIGVYDAAGHLVELASAPSRAT